jgi:hypothetical protein
VSGTARNSAARRSCAGVLATSRPKGSTSLQRRRCGRAPCELAQARRIHLGKHGHWPRRKDVLFSAADTFELPPIDPDVALSALLGRARQRSRRRQRAIDQRVPGVWSGSEEERRELLRPVAQIVHQRLAQFGLAK